MALNDPAPLHALLSVTTDAVIAYLSAQRAAGAQALQVFDTWGGVLAPHHVPRVLAALPAADRART